MEKEQETANWYRDYYARVGRKRNDLRGNPGVLFQTLANEGSVVKAMRQVIHDPSAALVLDVGCGAGGDLFQLLRLGYDPGKISGIDILSDRIRIAKSTYPSMKFMEGDARKMNLANDCFDLVFESTMFATLNDNDMRKSIAEEMLRICKVNGYILLVDWRTPMIWNKSYKALTRKEVRRLFGVGTRTTVETIQRGALVPPIGRFLSAFAPWIYFLVAGLLPFLVGQVTYVLKKTR